MVQNSAQIHTRFLIAGHRQDHNAEVQQQKGRYQLDFIVHALTLDEQLGQRGPSVCFATDPMG